MTAVHPLRAVRDPFQVLRLALICFLVSVSIAVAATASAADPPNALNPAEKDPGRHQEFLAIAKAGGVDLLFLGDSITDGWRNGGLAVWNRYFAPLKAANFGIGGDQTQHVIWRLRHGELDGIHPKVVVLMIGTNNSNDPAEDVAEAIKTIIEDIHSRSPTSRVLLLGIFPRGEHPDGRQKNEDVNRQIAKFADGQQVVYLDIGPRFLTADGTLSKDIFPDLLHPNDRGYQIWADAIIDTVKRMMRVEPELSFPVPSEMPKVAKVEELIASGKVGVGVKALERLCDDKSDKTSAAAKASLAVVQQWKSQVDAEIADMHGQGDVYAEAKLVSSLATSYKDTDEGKAYQKQAADLKKDPAYPAGKEFQKLLDLPSESRTDPRFAKLVAAFLRKYPTGYYAQQAQAMLPTPAGK